MKETLRGATFRWFFFTVVLSLLQLWVLIAFRFFREDDLGLWEILFDGGLIFYANSVSMDVLARKWDEFRIVTRERGGMDLGRDHMFLYGVFLPALVLVIAVVMYCALLSKVPPSSRIVWGELLLTAVALMASASHVVQFSRRFRVASEHAGETETAGVEAAGV